LRLGKPRCIDLIHTCLRPRCDNVRSRGHRKSLQLRSAVNRALGSVHTTVISSVELAAVTHVTVPHSFTCSTLIC
jgi:hypothetical protein